MHLRSLWSIVLPFLLTGQALAGDKDERAFLLADYATVTAEVTAAITHATELRAKGRSLDPLVILKVMQETRETCNNISLYKSKEEQSERFGSTSAETSEFLAMQYACWSMRDVLQVEIDRQKFGDRVQFLDPLQRKYQEIWQLTHGEVATSLGAPIPP